MSRLNCLLHVKWLYLIYYIYTDDIEQLQSIVTSSKLYVQEERQLTSQEQHGHHAKKVYIILLITVQKINSINTVRIDQHQTLSICERPYQILSMQLLSEGKQLSDRSGDILDQLRRNAELLTTVISRIEMQDNEISSIKRKMSSL